MHRQLIWRRVTIAFLFGLILSWSGCGGGGASSSSGPSPNPVPSITTLSPSSVTAGAAAQTLTINGSNFLASSTVTYNAVAHTATFVSSTQLRISLTAGDQATAGNFPVIVTNQAPGGGASNAVNFVVNKPPQPVITSVTSIVAETTQSIVISGSGFGSGPPQTVPVGDGSVDTVGCNTTTPSLLISDKGAGKDAWAAGHQTCSNVDAIGVYLVSWSDSQIVLSGFGSALGTTSASTYEISPGDPIVVDVTGPNGAGDGVYDTTVTSVGSVVILATPANGGPTTGAWTVAVAAVDSTGKGIANLLVSMNATAGTISPAQGLTDSTGTLMASVSPPASNSGQAVAVSATGGGRTAVVNIAFVSSSSGGSDTVSSRASQRKLLRPLQSSSSGDTTQSAPFLYGTSAETGASNPFGDPNLCYSNAYTSATVTTTCPSVYSQNGVQQSAPNIANTVCTASLIVGVASCVGTTAIAVSCLASGTGVGLAICVGTVQYVGELATVCVGFLADALATHLTGNPDAAASVDAVTIDLSSANPADILGLACDTATIIGSGTGSSGTQVTINPALGDVPTGGDLQFAATVSNNTNTAVTWSVNGGAAGYGSISSSGLYTAPTTLPSPNYPITVTATSAADPTAIAHALVTITLPYSFSALMYPGSSTAAYGINGSGEVVGEYGPNLAANSVEDGYGGFSYAGGAYSIIEYPGTLDFQACGTFAAQGAQGTAPSGINDSGEIVGLYQNCSDNDQAYGFLYDGGSFSSISYPGAEGTELSGINNSGEMVGSYLDSNSNFHGFLDSGGVFSSVDFPGATMTVACGINDSGQIVGTYVDSNGNQHAFLYSAGTFSTMDYPGAISTAAFGINSSGQIVGSYSDSSFNTHGLLYAGGVFTSIDYPGATGGYTAAYRINDNGQIVGTYAPLAGDWDLSGFLATPNQ